MLTHTNNTTELDKSVSMVEEKIVEQIFEAVIDQRLRAGTKLSESDLCKVFKVGRMRIRRSLLLLASREVVEIIPNRGAFIASPTSKQSHDIFQARMAIEPNIARISVQNASAKDLKLLTSHIKSEKVAHDKSDRHGAIRLSGLFHVNIARIAGNSVMLRIIKELVARSSLIIGIYGAPGVANCRDDDHSEILSAFITKDEDMAAQLMSLHLKNIMSQINFERENVDKINLSELFTEIR